LGTIGNGLATALSQEREREAALVTFLVTASGVALFGIGSAFWGLFAGALSLAVLRTTPKHLSSVMARLASKRTRVE
jgi:benzoate membrane transport protein